ncbi:subunit 17 of mediator complex-domain-containing protein [Lyophyllum atratum]|nr:subunit 17 of mediator complex-domain-containing protein [Lyophyllum atratum]
MGEPSWKQIKLAVERPYKDDSGDRIPTLLDISADGQHIYEQKAQRKLLEKISGVSSVERGVDFFDRTKHQLEEGTLSVEDEDTLDTADRLDDEDSSAGPVNDCRGTVQNARGIIPQLFTSLGEISLARDLLTSLLASSQPQSTNQPINLSATVVSKPPPIISVQAFNAQLTIGSKDEALRKAANVFRSAADSMERGRIKGEKYWVDALKVRKANWGLIPAPLPFGSATGKGADKTSKDFLISYGLEECSQVAHMATDDTTTDGLVFFHRHRTRLRVSVTVTGAEGTLVMSQNTPNKIDLTGLEGALKVAQQEVVEQEIFSLLVQEAGNLPTASARVSERLIVIDAAQGTELKFELCNLIYFALHVLLLRRHGHLKSKRLGTAGINGPPGEASRPPPVLQPIIDLLQYQVFCERINSEIDKMIAALSAAGIPASLRFDSVGETGRQLVQFFESGTGKVIGGEAVLRIDNRHTIRLTFLSPSSLTAHLSQATLTISSIPQLCQLLTDEVERCLLHRICERGKEMCEHVGGTWFVDLSRCVGRWEGCVLNFHIAYGKDFAIDCSAFQLHRKTPKQGQLDTYSSGRQSRSLLSWIEHIIDTASSSF